jgi:hypothetical protein
MQAHEHCIHTNRQRLAAIENCHSGAGSGTRNPESRQPQSCWIPDAALTGSSGMTK